jgi:spore germination protein YaaH
VPVGAGLFLLGRSDAVAGGVAVVGMVALATLAIRRGPWAIRRSVLGLLAGAVILAVAAALVLAVPLRPVPPRDPLLVTPPDGAAPAAQAAPAEGAATVLGFVAPDYGDGEAVIDRDGPLVSSVAATGITLGRKPGTIAVLPARDALARAHLHGATALAVVSNYDGTQFSDKRAAAVLASPSARQRLVTAVVSEADRAGWDGIVLDLERLPASSRVEYPMLVSELRRGAGNRPVLVAVPARDPDEPDDEDGYDLAALGRVADHIIWMAYDQHTPSGEPGPIAGLPWVRRTLAVATSVIPPEKLLLGVAGYGYAWSGRGRPRDLTVAEAQALASQAGSAAEFDPEEQEWRVRAADGTEVWYADARSTAVRAALAAEQHLAGIAVWRLGAEDPTALTTLPFPVRRASGVVPGEGAEVVQATGLVALSFDDGPDPRFTSALLAILRRKHVPATFFVIAEQAQVHPALVRKEIREGHVVANHTYSHLDLSAMPKARAEAEILAGAGVIEGITGRKPALFRSPFGEDATTHNGDALADDRSASRAVDRRLLGLAPAGRRRHCRPGAGRGVGPHGRPAPRRRR